MTDEIIRDRLVLGVRDKNTRKELLKDANLRLESAIEKCKVNETMDAQLKSSQDLEEVNRIKEYELISILIRIYNLKKMQI